MHDLFGCEEGTAFLHVIKNGLVGILIVHTCKLACVLCLITLVINGDDDIHVIAAAGNIVVRTEAGSRMNTACTAVHCNVICVYDNAFTVDEGVRSLHKFKVASTHGFYKFKFRNTADRHGLICESGSDNIEASVGSLDNRIFFIRVKSDSEVSGQGPRGSCPYNEICLVKVANVGELAHIVLYLELYIDGGTCDIFVFDFCFRKSGFVMVTPINRLETLIDIALFEHFTENLYLTGFKRRIHCEIRLIPVGGNAETLELSHLDIDEVLGELMASLSKFGNRHFFTVKLVLFYNCTFDRHAVVIPAGSIWYAVSHHVL